MDSNFDNYFDELDNLDNDKKQETKCCDDQGNYMIDEGIITCRKCNNTISNIIDSPEWRFYGDNGKNPTRCGMPVNVLLPGSSLGTTISGHNSSIAMNKINMYQKWNSMPYKERSLYNVFTEIETKCDQNNLPKIISTTSKSLYRVISETKISRGSNRKGIIAASVYYACKECSVPRSTKELAHIFDIDSKVMTKGCKNFTEIMRMSTYDKSRVQSHKSIRLDDFIERFSHKLSLDKDDICHILRISNLCQEMGINNDNTPPAMASGCIYLYITRMKMKISKKEISDICKISEVTINKCYKKLENIPEITECCQHFTIDKS